MSKVNKLHLDMIVLTKDGMSHTVVGWVCNWPVLVSRIGEEWVNYNSEEELFYVD